NDLIGGQALHHLVLRQMPDDEFLVRRSRRQDRTSQSQSGDGTGMFFEDIRGRAAATNALGYCLVPIMNGTTFAGSRQYAGRLVIGQGEARSIESAQSLIETGCVGSDRR